MHWEDSIADLCRFKAYPKVSIKMVQGLIGGQQQAPF